MTIRSSFACLALGLASISCGTSAPPGGVTPEPSAVVEPPPAETASALPSASAPAEVASTSPSASAPPVEVACTKIGCSSGLTLPLVWGKDTLTASKYTFELTVDGKKGKCEVFFPFKSCQDVRVPTCSGDVKFALETRCTGEAKSTSDMVIGPIRLEATPATASLKIWRDKVMWHQQELTLKYGELRPNGPKCEPVCQQASKRVCIGNCTATELSSAPPDSP
jgi:hypothetical protein